jgi:hypothetical protein
MHWFSGEQYRGEAAQNGFDRGNGRKPEDAEVGWLAALGICSDAGFERGLLMVDGFWIVQYEGVRGNEGGVLFFVKGRRMQTS